MRVFTISPSSSFLQTLIAALVDGRLIEGFDARAKPERLAEVTLYLPTRRAGQLARSVFLDVLNVDAAILPRIVPLRAIDEDELELESGGAQADPAALDLPPELKSLDRRLLLAQLIAAWAKQLAPAERSDAPLVAGGPAATLALADDLARLMDDMLRRGVAWESLDALVPDELDRYWQLTLKFLQIAREAWPGILTAHGRIEPALRENLLIEAETQRLLCHPGPVIAAGSTGSMPATAKFLHAIAGLPQGAVVLPGLDLTLDDAAWGQIGGEYDAQGNMLSPPVASHPQFALHGLLEQFRLTRDAVVQLGTPAPRGRESLTSEALRPSGSTADWHERLARADIAEKIASGFEKLAIVEAATPETEALAIAVALREAHELDITAALVTPDRILARRVMTALQRWDLPFDDSGGVTLTDTPAGLFARLAAASVAEQLAPATLLALLKHPLCRLGYSAEALKPIVATLEIALFRGTRPAETTAGLAHELTSFRAQLAELRAGNHSTLHRSELRARLDDDSLDAAAGLIARLGDALKPLEHVDANTPLDIGTLAARHREVLAALTTDEAGDVIIFDGRDGSALNDAFDDLAECDGASGFVLTLGDYPDVFNTAFSDRVVRSVTTTGARLRIYGSIEARLTEHERVILGGLTEGVWPPTPRTDAWLSRPMRHQLGLDLPERRIGLTAHDFAQLLGAPEVILTHAAKSGGSPTVASRFLHRLEAVAGEARWIEARRAGQKYLDYAAQLDRPARVQPIGQPQPRPPIAARPTALSVTQIEDWLRDPYTIYARHILNLQALDPIDMPLSAADRGSAIHNSLGDFTEEFADARPLDALRELQRIGQRHFAPLMSRPEARALWWPRYLRIAQWFSDWDLQRRDGLSKLHAEIHGSVQLPVDGMTFTLSARADRIEQRADGTYAVLDYKTGSPPSGKQVRVGLSPQLTLESVIIREGGFKDIPAGGSVSELIYVRLTGNQPAGAEMPIDLSRIQGRDPITPDEAADEAREKLIGLIRAFNNETQAYTSLNLAMWTNRYGEYDDLARIKEWSAGGGPEGGDA